MASTAYRGRMSPFPRGCHAWVDATAGVAGDMLLGALVDAGAPIPALQRAVDAVIPGATKLTAHQVDRAGLRAIKVEVERLIEDQPDRTWRSIDDLIAGADLPASVKEAARAAFVRLAEAEARVHGIDLAEVHFHEVGAWDSIADVVGTCAGLDELGVTSVSTSAVALGSGRTSTAHGDLPVPVPAVLALASGWRVQAGGRGELTTPTGMALLTALAQLSEDLVDLTVEAVGVGAGTNNPPERANVVRVVLGRRAHSRDTRDDRQGDQGASGSTLMTVLEANVDDMDPRLWPSVLSALLDAGAADAWLVPILMKKGRPAHTLKVLADETHLDALRRLVFEATSTIGIREALVRRVSLARSFVVVQLSGGGEVRVKVAHDGGRVVHWTTEFDDASDVATRRGVSVRQVLDEASAAADKAGLVPGVQLPES